MNFPAALGFTGNNPNNVTGLGLDANGQPLPLNSNPSTPTDPTLMLSAILTAIQQLSNQVAPNNQFMQKVSFVTGPGEGLAQGNLIQATVQPGLNCILNCLQRGTVNVYFGQTGNVYDLQLGAVANPLPTYMPQQNGTRTVIFETDAGSSTDAYGVVYVMRF